MAMPRFAPDAYVIVPVHLLYDPRLTDAQLGTYLRVKSRDWKNGQGCIASAETIGSDRKKAPQTRRDLDELHNLGLITISERPGLPSAIRCTDKIDPLPAHLQKKRSDRLKVVDKPLLQDQGCGQAVEAPVDNRCASPSELSTASPGDRGDRDPVGAPNHGSGKADEVKQTHAPVVVSFEKALPEDVADFCAAWDIPTELARTLIRFEGLDKVSQAIAYMGHVAAKKRKKGESIEKPAIYFRKAVQEGWKRQDKAEARKKAAEVVEAAKPPLTARYARNKHTGSTYRILNCAPDYGYVFVEGVGSLRPQDWVDFEWLEKAPTKN